MKKSLFLGLVLLFPVLASAATQMCFSRFSGEELLVVVSTRVTTTPIPISSLSGALFENNGANLKQPVFGAGAQDITGIWRLRLDGLDTIYLNNSLQPIAMPGSAQWVGVPCS